MTQIEFADFMGVTQGMVSKWESREYNFTIKSLNEICQKLDLSFSLNLETPCLKNDYTVIKWDEDKSEKKRNKNVWIHQFNIKEKAFNELVIVNGAALIGIARGKSESISANVFNNGKVVIPF